jgi:predicted DNA-binding WGR domain protein
MSDNILPGSGEYEFARDGSSKFWRCEPVRDDEPYGSYRITWGRIGTEGQSQVAPRETAAKRIREKVSKGYELVMPYAEDVRKKEQLEAQKRVKEKREAQQAATNFLEELFKIS